jgi:hypothetical protein
LGFAIGLVDKAALWATPARVARINGDNRNASALCLLVMFNIQSRGRRLIPAVNGVVSGADNFR